MLAAHRKYEAWFAFAPPSPAGLFLFALSLNHRDCTNDAQRFPVIRCNQVYASCVHLTAMLSLRKGSRCTGRLARKEPDSNAAEHAIEPCLPAQRPPIVEKDLDGSPIGDPADD